MPNAAFVRILLAGTVAPLLARGWPFPEAVVPYAAAGLAAAYGVLLALGRPRTLPRDALSQTASDSVFVSALVAGTGGGGSPFFPLYLVAALQVARIEAPARALAGAAALVGGYATAAVITASIGPGTLLTPSVGLRAGLLTLACAGCLSLGSEIRRGRNDVGERSRALAAERSLTEKDGLLLPKFGLVLRMLSLEAALQWAAEAAHAVTGRPYAHVAALRGNHHRTVFEGDFDVCPSWSHPQVQRLVLWSCREGRTVRHEDTVLGIGGLTAVPLGGTGREGWGAIVVGGERLNAAEERALERLAGALVPALERSDDALGGLDGASGLPNKAALRRFLRRELSRGRPTAVLAVGPEEDPGYGEGPIWGQALLERVGGRLEGGRGRAFRYEEGVFVVVVDASSGEGSARRAALAIRRRFAGQAGGPDQRLPPVAVGFALAGDGDEDPGPLLGMALRALEDARDRPEKVAGPPAGGGAPPGGAARTEEIVRALMAAMEARDSYLGGHVVGVSHVAGLIGREVSLSREQLNDLATGALLHDVGKIAIPDGILHKPGPLTAEEYETIKRHPVAGAEIVAPLEVLAPAIPAIRHHHERFDGGGYPDGLRGHDIPLVARVVCVADAFDTMTRDRRYGRGMSVAAARQGIQDKAGTQFDPQIAAAFLRATAGANGAKAAGRRTNPAG